MKKLLATLLLLTMSISLIACGGESETQKSSTTATQPEKAKEPEKSALPEFEIDDLKLKVLETKYFPANSTVDTLTESPINEPIVAIIYEMTGKREEPIDVGFAFIACGTIQQETKDTVESLDMSFFTPVELKDLKENTNKQLKKDGTVKAVALYTVKYPEAPVKVTFTKGIAGKTMAEMEIALN